jgi:hypothetical protein
MKIYYVIDKYLKLYNYLNVCIYILTVSLLYSDLNLFFLILLFNMHDKTLVLLKILKYR